MIASNGHSEEEAREEQDREADSEVRMLIALPARVTTVVEEEVASEEIAEIAEIAEEEVAIVEANSMRPNFPKDTLIFQGTRTSLRKVVITSYSARRESLKILHSELASIY